MEDKILVPLKRSDRVEDILSCLEPIVRPGVKVVFMVPESFGWLERLRDYFVNTESVEKAMAAANRLSVKYSAAGVRRDGEAKITPARRALGGRGVKVEACILQGIAGESGVAASSGLGKRG